MILSNSFKIRPSGARIYAGECFLKIGPDCERESQLLTVASAFFPEVLASSTEFLVLPLLHKTQDIPSVEAKVAKLRLLHSSSVKNPSWRLSSLEDYKSYCLYPRSPRVPEYLYQIIRSINPPRVPPVFVHGDATLSNSIQTSAGLFLIDPSVRPTTGDPLQDWTKLFFSAVLGFDTEGDLGTEYFQDWVEAHTINDKAFAFHLACNLVRVLRKEVLSETLLSRARTYLRNFDALL